MVYIGGEYQRYFVVLIIQILRAVILPLLGFLIALEMEPLSVINIWAQEPLEIFQRRADVGI
jgi:hypothetical protein